MALWVCEEGGEVTGRTHQLAAFEHRVPRRCVRRLARGRRAPISHSRVAQQRHHLESATHVTSAGGGKRALGAPEIRLVSGWEASE
jgi:hypothetical protein